MREALMEVKEAYKEFLTEIGFYKATDKIYETTDKFIKLFKR